ncbi:MAG: MFS transporter, partial [Paeniglutamicibacter sp.]
SSISYALGAVLGGAFAPTIATALVGAFNSTIAVSTYLFLLVAVSLVATITLKDRTGTNLYLPDEELKPLKTDETPGPMYDP